MAVRGDMAAQVKICWSVAWVTIDSGPDTARMSCLAVLAMTIYVAAMATKIRAKASKPPADAMPLASM